MTIGGTACAVGSGSWYFVHYVDTTDSNKIKYAVVNGSALGSISGTATTTTYVTKTVDGLKTVLFGALELTLGTYNSKSNIPYVVALASSTQVYDSAKGTYYNVFSTQDNTGKTVTIKADTGVTASKGKLYMVDVNSDGIASLTPVCFTTGTDIAGSWIVGKVDGYSSSLNQVVINGIYRDLDSATKIQYVSNGAIVTSGTFTSAAKIFDNASDYFSNVLYKLSGNKITDVFVNIDGQPITSLFAPSYIKFAANDDSTVLNQTRPFYLSDANGVASAAGTNLAINFILDNGRKVATPNLGNADVRLVITDQNNKIVLNKTWTAKAKEAYTFVWNCIGDDLGTYKDTRNYTYTLIVTQTVNVANIGNVLYTYTATATTAVNVATLANQPADTNNAMTILS